MVHRQLTLVLITQINLWYGQSAENSSGTESADSHYLFDTERGVGNFLQSNTSNAQDTSSNSVESFNNNGVSLGTSSRINGSGGNYVLWNFRAAPGFMDIQTWSGNEDSLE